MGDIEGPPIIDEMQYPIPKISGYSTSLMSTRIPEKIESQKHILTEIGKRPTVHYIPQVTQTFLSYI
jgi:hypothetical protein